MRKFLLSLTLFSAAFGLMAQQRTIKGVVSDPGGPIPMANVVIENTTRGAATDFDGKYEISVSDGETLVFSVTGLVTQKIKVGPKTPAVLNVNLKEDNQVLDEVVVVGYGVQRRSDGTGALASLNEAKLKEAVAVSVDQALQGRVTGVQVTQSSGQPGEASSVTIRGISSLGKNNTPLYVIDGMPMSNQGEVSSNPLASINPSDIVSMEVLKDASATAIYGSRASNGVIMVTTRKGKAGESRISYEGNTSVSQLPKKVDMMNLKDYAEYRNAAISVFGPSDVNLQNPSFLGEGTDWQDELFRLAFSHSHQLSVSGGDEKTQYAISLGYGDQKGIVINTEFQRFNGRINLETQAKKWLKVGTNMAYTHINKTSLSNNDDVDDEGIIIQTLLSLPSNPVKGIDGEYSGPQNDYGAKLNPIASAVQSPVEREEQNVLGNIYTQVQFYKDLMWRTEFGIDYTRAEEEQFTPTYKYGALYNDRSEMSRLDANNFTWRASSFVNYNKEFNVRDSIMNSVNAMVGVEATEWSYRGTTPSVTDLLSNSVHSLNLGTAGAISEYKGSGSMASTFARFVYNYGNRYILTATGRFDGSSNFAEENRWGFFPSFALAWRVDQERFAQRSETFNKVFSMFKARLGYGQTGNSNATPAHIGYVTLQKNDDTKIVQQVNYTNQDLKWETNWQINGGLDLGFLNRITLTVDAFLKQNEDLLLAPTLPDYVSQSAGSDSWQFIAAPYVNSGTIRNVGFEVSINSMNIKNRKFSWETNFNFTQVKNKVISTGAAKEPIPSSYNYLTVNQQPNRTQEGHAPGKFWGYKTYGIIQNTDELLDLQSQGRTEIGTQVGDIIFSEDMTWIGDPNPTFTAGLGNTFSYGPWSLTVYLTCSYGNDVFNMTKMQLEAAKSAWVNQMTEVKDFARVVNNPDKDIVMPDGQTIKYYEVVNSNTSIPRPDTEDANGNVGKISDRYIEDGSYLRIQNVSLSYSLSPEINRKLHINNLKLTANVQNVYTFSNYSGYDPEVVNLGKGVIGQGVDTGRYPSPRIYSLGLNFEF